MVAEAFLPSFGVVGFGGIVAFVVGAVILMDTDAPGFGIPLGLIVALAAVSALLLGGVLGMAIKARRRALVSGDAGLVGSLVTVTQVVADNPFCGSVQAQGEQWQVQCATPLQPGQHVRVTARHGVMLEVSATAPCAGEIKMFVQFGFGALLAVIGLLLLSALRILREYERGVVFQLGRFWQVKGPGLIILIPGIQQMVRVDLRTVVLDVPPQDVITRDNVSVKVNAVLYFRVLDPQKAIIRGRLSAPPASWPRPPCARYSASMSWTNCWPSVSSSTWTYAKCSTRRPMRGASRWPTSRSSTLTSMNRWFGPSPVRPKPSVNGGPK